MWSETVGLRTRLVSESDQKNGLGLACCGLACCGLGPSVGVAGLVLCCEKWSCYTRRHNDLEAHSNFSSTIYSFCFDNDRLIGRALGGRMIVM